MKQVYRLSQSKCVILPLPCRGSFTCSRTLGLDKVTSILFFVLFLGFVSVSSYVPNFLTTCILGVGKKQNKLKSIIEFYKTCCQEMEETQMHRINQKNKKRQQINTEFSPKSFLQAPTSVNLPHISISGYKTYKILKF